MSVTRAEVEKVAALARLHLDAEEAERLTADLNRILDRVAELRQVDVSGVDGIGVAAPGPAPLREDVELPALAIESVAAAAPDWRDGFFVLPRLAALDQSTEDLE